MGGFSQMSSGGNLATSASPTDTTFEIVNYVSSNLNETILNPPNMSEDNNIILPSPPGLPLGIYTSHWHRASSCSSKSHLGKRLLGQEGCRLGLISQSNHDIQGIFDIN